MKRFEKNENGREWLKRELRPYRTNIVALTLLTVLSVVLSLAFSYLLRYLINSATQKDKKLLLVFSCVVLSVVLLRVLVQAAESYLSEKYRAKIIVELRAKTFEKILRSDYAYADKYHSGDLLTRLTADVQEVAADSVSILPAVAGMVVQCVGAISALLSLDPLFTAICTAGGILVGVISAVLRKKVKEYHKEQTEADAKSRSYMQEGIASLLTVKAYGAEERSAKKAREQLGEYYGKRMKKNVVNSGMRAAFSVLGNASMLFAVVWCSIRVMRGESDYGSIMSVVMLLGQLQHPFLSFSSVLPVIYARAASGERLAETEDAKAETTERSDSKLVYANMRSFRLKDLSFTYGRTPVFEKANAEIEKGKITCITGDSGSGKSTLFKLLLSVYAPQSGELLVCGEENDIPVSVKERGLFAYVPQGNFLFSGTIYENLTFFSDEKDKEKLSVRIENALSTACADFVKELPEGLETSLRERGGGLSEGQLQRLAIARALLSDRPVLLLDEATSALDGETERRVLENIRAESGKTCLIVTHRPAALSVADAILRVENGKVRKTK